MQHVRIVMVHTSHPGNIGAAARAIKNMQLSRLYLVAPKKFPDAEASARASGATDILRDAVVCDTLAEAIADCHVVYALSAGSRRLSWPMTTPRQAAETIAATRDYETALVFGNERTGMTNEQLCLCNQHVHIPTNPDFSSLNLAQAVQVMTYELFQARNDVPAQPQSERDAVITNKQLHDLIDHFEQVLYQTEFIDPNHPKKLMKRLTRLFMRAELDTTETNILRGMLSSVERKIGQ